MTTYRFSISYDGSTDTTVVDLDNDALAWREALAVVSDAFEELYDRFRPSDEWHMMVANEHGKLFELHIQARAN
jgi:hypothetical protein